MRTTPDRIRHAISFEIIGLVTATPLGALAFDKPLLDIGVITLAGATVATIWNYLYNLGFDHALQRLTGTTQKRMGVRIGHAIGFEAGLLVFLLPFVAWYLGVSLMQALVMDIAFALYYVVYAFVFNWAYDRLFPLPEWQSEA